MLILLHISHNFHWKWWKKKSCGTGNASRHCLEKWQLFKELFWQSDPIYNRVPCLGTSSLIRLQTTKRACVKRLSCLVSWLWSCKIPPPNYFRYMNITYLNITELWYTQIYMRKWRTWRMAQQTSQAPVTWDVRQQACFFNPNQFDPCGSLSRNNALLLLNYTCKEVNTCSTSKIL